MSFSRLSLIFLLLLTLQVKSNSNQSILELPKNDKGYLLPVLGYSYDALEPFFDTKTMEIHHTKHHQSYINNLNNAITGTDAINTSLEDIIKNISKYSPTIRNNGGGHWNHAIFWKLLKINNGAIPKGKLLTQIQQDFGSFENFKVEFTKAALSRFGSGWAWLVISDGKLKVTSTPNQDNPLMDVAEVKGNPLIGLDVWEHAYYLKYQNRRNEFVENFWNVVNWEYVEQLYNEYLKK